MLKTHLSPLRYPGGKAILSNFLGNAIQLNDLRGCVYYELYAGGAGAALNLLFNNIVKRIVINDADYCIYAFWHSILNETEEFIKLIDEVDVTLDEWKCQKYIYENSANQRLLEVGFATFFLNRTNRSGIIHNAGPIGGMDQSGNYLIDVRFNKENLKSRIKSIANKKDKIELHNLKTEDFLGDKKLYSKSKKNSFFYLDPPYYYKGKELYLNNYIHDQHKNLSSLIKESNIKYWLISYDNVIEIRKMYNEFKKSKFFLNYTLQEKKVATELMIFSNELLVPDKINIRKKTYDLAIC